MTRAGTHATTGRTSPGDAIRRTPQRLRTSETVQLLVAAHPRQTVVTAAALALAAGLSGRPAREVLLVLATVLVGQTVLGWHNDLVDRRRDARSGAPHKPVASGALEPGSVVFAVLCGILLLVPLSIGNGLVAGGCYLAAVAVGMLGDRLLRAGFLSWVPWALQFGLYAFFLSYGGWGRSADGSAPEVLIVVLLAALGVVVHVLRALPGLVADHEEGLRHLPLRLAIRTGAPRLLLIAGIAAALLLVGLGVTGATVGLRQ